MDQNEFSRRLRLLAGAETNTVAQAMDPYTRILGSLGLVSTVRRTQAVMLGLIMGLGFVLVLHSVDLGSKAATVVLALSLAAAGLTILRRFPYWTPAGALSDGLLTLSSYPLNDLDSFIKHQRTDLRIVNNTLISDLCLQVAMDRRRPAAPTKTQQRIFGNGYSS